jgi:predicted enzyme related to lactoylglutathione lyase
MAKKTLIVTGLVITFFLGYAFKSITTPKTDQTPGFKKVTGIGGVFFKCKDPKAIRAWYQTHLGLNTDQYGTSFEWRQAGDSTKKGYTQWTPFSEKTKYFAPSEKDFMINYRVGDLTRLVEQLKIEGVTIVDKIEVYDYGKFVHILDPENNKIQLWEPIDPVYERGAKGITK